MVIDQEIANTTGILTCLGLLIGLFRKVLVLVAEHAKLGLKVEILWGFLMRRSLADGLDNDVLTMNSPITATKQFEELLEPMADELGNFYQTEGCKLSDRDLFISIEHLFGDRIMHEICIPHKAHQGAVIFAAIDVAKKRNKQCLAS